MKKTLKLLAILLIITAAATLLSSCKQYYTNDELVEIITPLLEKEAELNGYIYLNSFKTQKDPGDDVNRSYSKYYEVASDSKYKTCDELKNAIREIFTEDTFEIISIYAFTGQSDVADGGVSITPRFAENSEGVLQIDVTKEPYDMRGIIHPQSAKVKRSSKTLISAEVDFSRFSKDGTEIKDTKIIEMRLEDGVWKLNTQSRAIKAE